MTVSFSLKLLRPFILLGLIGQCYLNNAFSQGLNKNGNITTLGSEYININGTIGGAYGVDKNGKVVTADPSQVLTNSAINHSKY